MARRSKNGVDRYRTSHEELEVLASIFASTMPIRDAAFDAIGRNGGDESLFGV